MSIFLRLIFLPLCIYASLLSWAQPPLSLAGHYRTDLDLSQYWVSEKLDGVRAYWNGQQLLSRQGHPIHAPHWFLKAIPKVALDGELWLGHGEFQRTVSIVRKKKPIEEEWRHITYMIFDLPDSNQIFDLRLKQLRTLLSRHNASIKLIPHWRVSNHRNLQAVLQQYLQRGAEGLMLHRADSRYHAGRNQDILKLKPHYEAEATVVGHKAGKGKYNNKMGALLVERSDGLQFYLGTGFTDQQRNKPPTIGSIITYHYQGFTKRGVPRHASFVRLRSDHDF